MDKRPIEKNKSIADVVDYFTTCPAYDNLSFKEKLFLKTKYCPESAKHYFIGTENSQKIKMAGKAIDGMEKCGMSENQIRQVFCTANQAFDFGSKLQQQTYHPEARQMKNAYDSYGGKKKSRRRKSRRRKSSRKKGCC